MHYPATAFSTNGQATIVTIPTGASPSASAARCPPWMFRREVALPNRHHNHAAAHHAYIHKIRAHRGQRARDTRSPSTAPYSATTTLQFAANSSHTVAAPNAIEGDAKYTFVNWSDGGAQTHSFTLNAARSLTASYATAFKFTATACAGGRLSAITDRRQLLPAGTQVMLQATPNTGYCFTGWTNFINVVDAAIIVTLNGSGSTQANFASGISACPPRSPRPRPGPPSPCPSPPPAAVPGAPKAPQPG